ncbi:MAG: toll/interleukin-1 receptor domain-containing protein [Gemmatimonadales bacterium]|nr:toll/interleukin-1 receptor domain-containing protein [Gemmatimonadales bacterium]
MARHIFVSYVREDFEIVDRLAIQLESYGLSVWLDREMISPGVRWRDAIRHAIRSGDLFLACFSPASAARERAFMNEELTLAIDELRLRPVERTWFIPVVFTGGTVPPRSISSVETLRDLQWTDLGTDWDAGVSAIADIAFAHGHQPNTSKRMTMEHARELIAALNPAEFADLSSGRQLFAKALLNSSTDEEFVVALRKDFHLLSISEQLAVVKGAFDDPSAVFGPLRRLIDELPEEAKQEIRPSRDDAEAYLFKRNMLTDWRQLLAGDAEQRQKLYAFFRTPAMRALLSGPEGVFAYEEIVSIAVDAGAPLEEVRSQLIPLVGEERIDALATELIGKFLRSRQFERAVEKSLAQMKLETQRRRRLLDILEKL